MPMASRTLEVQRRLLQRLHRVVSEWPVDTSRKGRDLGEYLKETYVKRFKDECAVDVSAHYLGRPLRISRLQSHTRHYITIMELCIGRCRLGQARAVFRVWIGYSEHCSTSTGIICDLAVLV